MNMRKGTNNAGFTLMEMLIVVAVIAVLVVLALPSFTNSLEQTREESDLANLRSAYSSAMADALMEDSGTGTATFTVSKLLDGFLDATVIPSYLSDSTTWAVVTAAKRNAVITVTVNANGDITYSSGDTATILETPKEEETVSPTANPKDKQG